MAAEPSSVYIDEGFAVVEAFSHSMSVMALADLTRRCRWCAGLHSWPFDYRVKEVMAVSEVAEPYEHLLVGDGEC
ncbi:hypothetical protein Ssi02_67270 [Sinosporangium siamense]|uniref:Uncharacterized protein n=1 Tax=Sinosporangium siamense TaxID=1367973 RepID=A0A919VAI1_9ACTN|nr:hypothetical protein Ssi02_67270 [Sinosporangium siamense]